MPERRKVSAVVADFINRMERLQRLDAQNQQRFRAGPGRPGRATLSRHQMEVLTEGIYIRALTAFELFLEESFILYMRSKPTVGDKRVKSFVNPKDAGHARDMMKSHLNFLEWNSPDIVIKRCEIFLEEGGPIKQAIAQNLSRLQNMRKVRNAIAHNSAEARTQYASVVRLELRAAPLHLPEPGGFLLMADPSLPRSYFLISYWQLYTCLTQRERRAIRMALARGAGHGRAVRYPLRVDAGLRRRAEVH